MMREMRAVASECLPAPDYAIYVKRIEFQPETAPPGTFRRNQRAAAPQKAVEYYVSTCGGVHDRVGYHGNRFDGGVRGEQIALIAQRENEFAHG